MFLILHVKGTFTQLHHGLLTAELSRKLSFQIGAKPKNPKDRV